MGNFYDIGYGALIIEGPSEKLAEVTKACDLKTGPTDDDSDYVVRDGVLILEDWWDGATLHWLDGVSRKAMDLGCVVTWLIIPSPNLTAAEMLSMDLWTSAKVNKRDRMLLFNGFISNDYKMRYIEFVPMDDTYAVGLKNGYSFRRTPRCG